MKAKIIFLLQICKHYPLTCALIAAIWVVCFINIPETPLSHVSFIDKWTHFAMYAFLCIVVSAEHLHHRGMAAAKWGNMLVCWLWPVLMSGLIEILQANCTGGRRSGDWLDFAANAVGATIGMALIGILLAVYRARARRDW